MTPLQWLQAIGVLIAITASAIAVARTVFVTEVKVEALAKAIDRVEHKADGTDKEVTGPVNIKAATLARDITYALDGIARVEAMLATHISEYRADQKGKGRA